MTEVTIPHRLEIGRGFRAGFVNRISTLCGLPDHAGFLLAKSRPTGLSLHFLELLLHPRIQLACTEPPDPANLDGRQVVSTGKPYGRKFE